MKHKSFNRTLATLLSVMLMVGLLPTTVFAAENYNIIVSLNYIYIHQKLDRRGGYCDILYMYLGCLSMYY